MKTVLKIILAPFLLIGALGLAAWAVMIIPVALLVGYLWLHGEVR